MAHFHNTGGESFQVRFGAATGRKSAPDESYGKMIGSHLRHHGTRTLLARNHHNTC
jgi:hypothetical protein